MNNLVNFPPQEMLDNVIGSKVWIITKGDKEIVGIMRGFDKYMNCILDEVKEYEYTKEGRKVKNLDSILLNGNHIAMFVPGSQPD